MNWPVDRNDFSDIWPLAVEVSGTAIWDQNAVTGEMRCSASWFKILGYENPPQSNQTEIVWAHVHPDDLEYVKATMQAHREGKTERCEGEYRLRCKDGTYKWVFSRGKVVSRDADGNALRMAGTTTEINKIHPLATKKKGGRASASLPERKRAAPRRRKPYVLEETPVFPQRRTQSIPCFTRGTAILTPRGPVAVETLAEGDAVLTVRESGPSERRVLWVGQRTFGTTATLPRVPASGPDPRRRLRSGGTGA